MMIWFEVLLDWTYVEQVVMWSCGVISAAIP